MIKRALIAAFALALTCAPSLAQYYPNPNQGTSTATITGIGAMGAAGGTAQSCLPGTECIITLLPLANGSELQVATHPTGIFVDDFACVSLPGCTKGILDTTNRWNAPTTGGGGNATAATNAIGATVMGSGTLASGFSILQTQVAFQPTNPGYLFSQNQVKVEATAAGLFKTNAFRAWGDYSAPGTPTTVAPLTDAVVFVIDTNGKLRAQTWASGGLNFDSDLSVFQTMCNCTPQTIVGDGATHRYVRIVRGDNILWKIDDRFVAQITTGALGPDVNTLQEGGITIAGSTPPATSATIEFDQVTIGAIATNVNKTCDAFFGWRCAVVTSGGQLVVSSAPNVSGSYCMSQVSGTMAAGLAANAPIVSWRYGGANLAILRKVIMSAQVGATGFAAGNAEFDVFAARSFTVSDTGGQAATLTGNNGKLRTVYGTTALSDFRTSTTATLTAGTRTLDATALNKVAIALPVTANIPILPAQTPVFDQRPMEQPATFATSEGFVIQATVPATGVWTFTVTVCWDEATSF